jgi:hypothetical protein
MKKQYIELGSTIAIALACAAVYFATLAGLLYAAVKIVRLAWE